MLSLSTLMASSSGDSRTSASMQTLPLDTGAMRPHAVALIAAILGLPAGHPDVEDCTHETLRRALEARTAPRSSQSARSWVLGIARHVALDAIRERQRARGRAAEGLETIADRKQAPEELVMQSERRDRVQRLLDGLPQGQRQALVLFHVEGLGYQEVALRMGVPLGTVATWITRARHAMAAALADEGS